MLKGFIIYKKKSKNMPKLKKPRSKKLFDLEAYTKAVKKDGNPSMKEDLTFYKHSNYYAVLPNIAIKHLEKAKSRMNGFC